MDTIICPDCEGVGSLVGVNGKMVGCSKCDGWGVIGNYTPAERARRNAADDLYAALKGLVAARYSRDIVTAFIVADAAIDKAEGREVPK